MLKITNGISVFEVTRGAFEGIYSPQGYTIVDDKNNVDSEDYENVKEGNEDEKFLQDIVQKPISQWKKEDVKRFAKLKDIDISDTKSANEAKEIIKNFL